MSQHADIETIELSIEEAKKGVNKMRSLERLYKNRDFKNVVITGLFEEEAARLVALKADPQMQNERMQDALMREIDMIGALQVYFRRVFATGKQLVHEIEEHENTRDEIMREEVEA